MKDIQSRVQLLLNQTQSQETTPTNQEISKREGETAWGQQRSAN